MKSTRVIITFFATSIFVGTMVDSSAKPKKNTIIEAATKLDEAEPFSEVIEAKAADETTKPVLVSGTPQEEEQPVKAPETGVAVRVDKLSTGQGIIDPSSVKLLAPYPPKALAQPPAGWRLDTSDSATPFTREVEIAAGSKITLTIRPHLLVPDADGAQVFSIPEPGYDSALGYQQVATIGAILGNSISQLDEDSKYLGASIERLQQLLISLPKSEPQAAPEPPVKPAIFKRK